MGVESKKWYQSSPGEKILWESHPSFLLWLPKIAAGVILGLSAFILAPYVQFFTNQPTAVVYILLALIPFGFGMSGFFILKFKKTWYVITNRRVIEKTKIIGRDSSSKPHHEIVRTDVFISTIAAILSRFTSEDIGDIEVRTADDTGEAFRMRQIPEVHLAEKYVDELSSDEDQNIQAMDENRQDKTNSVGGKHLPADVSGEGRTTEDTQNRFHEDELLTDSDTRKRNTETQSDQTEKPTHPSANIDEPGTTTDIDEELDEFEPSDNA